MTKTIPVNNEGSCVCGAVDYHKGDSCVCACAVIHGMTMFFCTTNCKNHSIKITFYGNGIICGAK
jgi:hypothetical protein